MKLLQTIVLLIPFFFVGSAHAQSCNQTFSIDATATVPGIPDAFDTGLFGGMQCGALERYRTDIYVNNLLSISDAELAELAKWQATRATFLTGIANAEARLAAATSSAETQAAVTVAFHYVGYGMTLAGCNPSAVTGWPALSCVGGFVLTQAGTVWSFATMNGSKDQAQAALRDVRNMLEAFDSIGDAERNQAVLNFKEEFEAACYVVRTYCLN